MAKRVSKPVTISDDIRIMVLVGAEPMLKQQYFDELKEKLAARHGELETLYFDGRSSTLAEVLDELRTFSLMQLFKVIVVDEADQFVKANREGLQRYAESPVDNAVLVLRSINWNSPKLDKLVAKVGVKIKCDALSMADSQRWLADRARGFHQVKISSDAVTALVERVGCDLMRLDSELAKLKSAVKEGGGIDLALVDALSIRASDEQAWDVQDPILQMLDTKIKRRNTLQAGGRAIEKLHEVIEMSGQPDVLVMFFVADLFRKLNQASLLSQQGTPDGQIVSSLKIWPRQRQSIFMSVAKGIPPAKLHQWFGEVLAADRNSKSGLGKTMGNLECFLLNMADN